jgi:hypothetical protein
LTLIAPSTPALIEFNPKALNRRDLAFALLGAAGLWQLAGCATFAPPLSSVISEQVQRVGLRLVEQGFAERENAQFGMVSNQEPIAFVSVSKTILVSSGALALCQNDGQVAAILAHVIARQKAVHQTVSAGGSSFANGTRMLSKAPLSRAEADLMRQADDIAIISLARAGYDPRDGLDIWIRIGRTGGDGALALGDRMSAIAAQLNKMGYQI